MVGVATRIQVNEGLALNYELDGDPASQPVMVLTHGMGGSHASWDADVPELAERYAVLRWDVRGHGDSDNRMFRTTPPCTPAIWRRC